MTRSTKDTFGDLGTEPVAVRQQQEQLAAIVGAVAALSAAGHFVVAGLFVASLCLPTAAGHGAILVRGRPPRRRPSAAASRRPT